MCFNLHLLNTASIVVEGGIYLAYSVHVKQIQLSISESLQPPSS